MDNIVTHRNCLYPTAYDVIWCPKYGHEVLTGTVGEEAGIMRDTICTERGWPVISKEIQPDHLPLFVSIVPAIAVADAVKVLKGIPARRRFEKFPALKKRGWDAHRWSVPVTQRR